MAPRAIQHWIRQSPRKMRLVIDEVRGRGVNDAYAYLRFSKKRAAKQIEKVLRSAVANAEQDALKDNRAFDVDRLVVSYAIVNEGPSLRRFRAAAHGRAVQVLKRMSSVEIDVTEKEA